MIRMGQPRYLHDTLWRTATGPNPVSVQYPEEGWDYAFPNAGLVHHSQVSG